MNRPLRIATRGSALALRQVALVAELLDTNVQPVVISTVGDRLVDVPLRTIAGSGAFTGEVRAALAAGSADLAVHSAKDLPAADDPRFATAYPPRGDTRDALVGATLATLGRGATVATGAPRRRAQLASLRPDLRFVELRGNIETRLAKGAEVDAVIVAAAALRRLEIVPSTPVQLLPVDEFVPQVGQGALAVDARSNDTDAHVWLNKLDDATTRLAVTTERTFLGTLGGDCDLPAGAHATVGAHETIVLHSFLADADGHTVRHCSVGDDPKIVGATAARWLRDQLDGQHWRTVA